MRGSAAGAGAESRCTVWVRRSSTDWGEGKGAFREGDTGARTGAATSCDGGGEWARYGIRVSEKEARAEPPPRRRS
ncbi:hypothetical protein GCM10010329_09370 [Streptomyces spiroverticillatus]|uniref:Uncharacterized protein n=1 Tax=Streptomyces finlayi TaxID=67296 RepID=A0A919CA53_9ACTN|nr:hypothetical protein GCM10010329_09370 [Streptomyces spiroverticillatus]GHC93990.1 hypothetical protein GCM10010334_31710 [Streptomyces finlayi]